MQSLASRERMGTEEKSHEDRAMHSLASTTAVGVQDSMDSIINHINVYSNRSAYSAAPISDKRTEAKRYEAHRLRD